jgi:hypothetical protein
MDELLQWLRKRRDDYNDRKGEMRSLEIRASEVSAIIQAIEQKIPWKNNSESKFFDVFDNGKTN